MPSLPRTASPSTVLHSASALAVLLVLGACATPNARHSTAAGFASRDAAVEPPAQWQQPAAPTVAGNNASRDATALAVWWQQFHDPVLDQLIAGALAASPDVRTALARIEEARARHGIQRASLLPTLAASASAQGASVRDHAAGTTSHTESYGASLDASWELDLFGRQRATLSATAADLAQTEENFRGAQASLAAEVATSYVALRSAEAQLAVLQDSLRTREETVQLTRWREQSGTGSALETQQAVSTFEQARAAAPSLQQTITQTRHQLAPLSGQAPGALDALLTPASVGVALTLAAGANTTAATPAVPTAPTTLATGIPAETLLQRADVRAAARAAEAAAARTAAARRERLPTLNLSGSIGVEALQAGRLFDPAATIASVLGGLSAPLFAGGRIQNSIRAQDAVEQQVLLAYESTVLTALFEVENALVSVQRSAERGTILVAAVTAARDATQLAALQFESGQVDLLTVLDAQRTLLSLAQQQVTTTAEHTTAQIQLYKALGGGWSATPAAGS